MTFFFLLFSYCYSVTVVLIFSPLPSSQPIPYSHSKSPHCCPSPWVIHTCSLTDPFPFLPPLFPSPFPSDSCQFVLCSHISGSILLISLFSYFIFNYIVLIMLLQLSQFSSFPPQHPPTPSGNHNTIVHIHGSCI